jgi:alkylhydroperoxidase family enzyme
MRRANEIDDDRESVLPGDPVVLIVEDDPHFAGEFSEQELADLTLAIVAINGWNRIAISFRQEPGTYEPAHK